MARLDPPLSHLPVSLIALAKPRLSAMSVLTALFAYATAKPAWNFLEAFFLVLGTLVSAAGAMTLNQWWERKTDALMPRTRNRPLPAGAISSQVALAWGLSLSFIGPSLLLLRFGDRPALFALTTIILYALVYTPMKRNSRWATELGAIPGALPVLLGWSAAMKDASNPLALLLFGLLFFWQLPHFFAIGWIYRNEYRKAGFPLLPARDTKGRQTGIWMIVYSVGLVSVSISPWLLGYATIFHGLVGLVGAGSMLYFSIRFLAASGDRNAEARVLFRSSLIFLPVAMGSLVLESLWV